MAEFREAFLHTLRFEDSTLSGKVTVDAGGGTRFGIAEKFHPELGGAFFEGSAEEAQVEAERIEQADYWEPMRLGDILSQEVADKLFDMAVNMGIRQASVLAQRAANALLAAGAGHSSTLVEDGAIGPRSLAAIDSLDPERYLEVLREMSVEFYRHVAAINPADAVDLAGWLRRARA